MSPLRRLSLSFIILSYSSRIGSASILHTKCVSSTLFTDPEKVFLLWMNVSPLLFYFFYFLSHFSYTHISQIFEARQLFYLFSTQFVFGWSQWRRWRMHNKCKRTWRKVVCLLILNSAILSNLWWRRWRKTRIFCEEHTIVNGVRIVWTVCER